ncbi:MAG: diphosphomevalonate decarboxylase [Deltaproteobacteria bacterium]|nr:diphosphomevalonate decarboxylase [Deltaproteobacteria bacterium]
MHVSKARARTNIALVKYWGKRDGALNLPAVGSISMTLSSLHTTTEVGFDTRLSEDTVVINGRPAQGRERERVCAVLDVVRQTAGAGHRAAVRTENNFPTASGLASSASGFAALAAAAARAAGLELPVSELSRLARLGSGSAPRSILGGFVELPAGVLADGSDCVPREILPPDAWDVRLLVAVNGRAEKAVGSTEGMERTKGTSPYYRQWVETHAADMQAAADAIRARGIARLGAVVESSCFKMHASMMAATPPILYWNGATVEVIRTVRDLRNAGLDAYVTIDAGPHVKVLCPAAQSSEIADRIAKVDGVERVIVERPGPGVEILT